MNRLVLIDGNAILHRAYHALPPLTAPDGSLVNAVYGFTSILIKLFSDLKPTHLAVAFDRPEPTFRKKMYVDYQAKRPEMEDALSSQIPKVQEVVRAFGIPIYDAAGFEADDVLATIAKRALDKREIERRDERKIFGAHRVQPSGAYLPMEVIIVTGDRDILQLVNDEKGIKVFMPTKGLSEGKLFGEKDVTEKMGVTPDQIPDLKALMGDASDNYPGVAGIGPKTAVGLLATYGSVKGIYRILKELKGKKFRGKISEGISAGIFEKLVEGENNAMLSEDLATIRTNAPVDFDKENARVETLDTLDARAKLAELHFPSLVKRLSGKVEKQEKPKKEPPKKLEDKKEQLSLV